MNEDMVNNGRDLFEEQLLSIGAFGRLPPRHQLDEGYEELHVGVFLNGHEQLTIATSSPTRTHPLELL